jgi:hypothetical protein
MVDIDMRDFNANKHPWNVIEEHEFKQLMLEIFNKIYNALKCTAGPYGSGTIIERLGQ